jgi:hypothetical protein
MQALAQSVAVIRPVSPERPARLNNLANGLRRRYERDGRAADAEEVTATYRAGQRLGLQVATEAALRCGLNWGGWSLRRRTWAQAQEAYDAARTAPTACSGSSSHAGTWKRGSRRSAICPLRRPMHGAGLMSSAWQPYGSNGGVPACCRMCWTGHGSSISR